MSQRDNSSDAHQDPRRTVALAIWTLMGLVAVLVMTRAVSGALVRPLPAWGLLAWSLAGIVLSAAAGECLRRAEGNHQRATMIAGGIAVLFAGCWVPIATPFQVGMTAGVLLLYAGTAAFSQASGGRKPPVEMPNNETAPIDRIALHQGADAPPSEDSETDNATQWMIRRIEELSEICEGHILIEFPQGQRELTAHVAFCPPLCSVPEVELEDLDGCGWELKTTAAYPYGLRITARRPAKETGSESGRIAYWASATRTEHAAA